HDLRVQHPRTRPDAAAEHGGGDHPPARPELPQQRAEPHAVLDPIAELHVPPLTRCTTGRPPGPGSIMTWASKCLPTRSPVSTSGGAPRATARPPDSSSSVSAYCPASVRSC